MKKKEFLYFEIKNIITGIITFIFLWWLVKYYGAEEIIAKSVACLIVNLYFVRASAILDVVKLFFKSRK